MVRQSSNGNNNTQIVGDGNIVVGDGFLDNLMSAISAFDLGKVGQLTRMLSRMLAVTHEDFHLSLGLEDESITIQGNHNRTIDTSLTVEVPENFSHCCTFEDVVRHSHFKQLNFDARVVQSQTRIGGNVIESSSTPPTEGVKLMKLAFTTHGELKIHQSMSNASVSGHWISIPPIPFPPAVQVVIESGMTSPHIETALRTSEITDQGSSYLIEMTNTEHSAAPCDVLLIATLPKAQAVDDAQKVQFHAEASINLKLREGGTVYKTLQFYNLLTSASSSRCITVRASATGTPLIQETMVTVNSETRESWEDKCKLLTLMLELEQAFGTQFNRLPDITAAETCDVIGLLSQIARFGKVTGTVERFTARAPKNDMTMQIIEQGGIHNNVNFSQSDCYITLEDTVFHLGDRITFLPGMKLVDIDGTRIRLNDYSEGDLMSLEFEPFGDHDTLEVYPKFYGTDDVSVIAKREQWRYFEEMNDS